MNELMTTVLDPRTLRKAAFAIAVGATVGRYVGKAVTGIMDGITVVCAKRSAENGNEFWQTVCDRSGVKYKTEATDDQNVRMKCGFYCE